MSGWQLCWDQWDPNFDIEGWCTWHKTIHLLNVEATGPFCICEASDIDISSKHNLLTSLYVLCLQIVILQACMCSVVLLAVVCEGAIDDPAVMNKQQ